MKALTPLVLDQLKRDGPQTADEVDEALGESVLAVRPRVSELVRENLVVATGMRRPNKSGRTAWVWRAAS
jgi:predicted ArsR family transcriptional regulator